MAPAVNFGASLAITHIGTATAIIHIDGVNLLTDPFFSPAGTEWDLGIAVLKNTDTPALGLADLPPIDAVLLSHEDHPDNLDEPGRATLDGRHVFTTADGAKKLAPRPGVKAIGPWYVSFINSLFLPPHGQKNRYTKITQGGPDHPNIGFGVPVFLSTGSLPPQMDSG